MYYKNERYIKTLTFTFYLHGNTPCEGFKRTEMGKKAKWYGIVGFSLPLDTL